MRKKYVKTTVNGIIIRNIGNIFFPFKECYFVFVFKISIKGKLKRPLSTKWKDRNVIELFYPKFLELQDAKLI